MLHKIFDRNNMQLYVGKVKTIDDKGDGSRVVNLEVEDLIPDKNGDKAVAKVAFWNSTENTDAKAQRADRVRKMKIKPDSVISYLAFEKDDQSGFVGIDIKYVNGVWNFRATPEEKERNVIIARLVPGKETEKLSKASFTEYNFAKKDNTWSEVNFFNYDENNLGERAAKDLTLNEGQKSKLAIVIANPATYSASKKLDDGSYDNKDVDETFTSEEAEKQGYDVRKKYSAIKLLVLDNLAKN